jgi:ATP-dependent RNA helicase RhlE
MNNFSDFKLSTVLKSNLSRAGFVKPTPVQSEAIPPALEGRDVIATAQTGTGKTLAFVVPILESLSSDKARLDAAIQASVYGAVRALILTPTRELAMQIHETFAKLQGSTGLQAVVVCGGMNETRQLRAIRGGASIVVATPGRLVDFLDRKLIKLSGVKTLVMDEADRMLDMGFLPSIKTILKDMPESRQTLFFSATIENSVKTLINTYLKNPVRVAMGSTTKVADNIDLNVYEVEQNDKVALLQSMLKENKGSFLIFARTKHGTERLAKHLAMAGTKAARIHGDRTQNQRNEAMKGFKEGHYRVLVATDVAARGIDVQGISHVVNFDLPQAPEDFIHRVGRTARAGMRGIASTFCTRAERYEIRRIERTLNIQLTRQPLPAMEAPAQREIRSTTDRLMAETLAGETRQKVVVMPYGQARRTDSKPFNGGRNSKFAPRPAAGSRREWPGKRKAARQT